MAVSPYTTAIALGRPGPSYVDSKQVLDVERITAYGTYSDIFYNVPEALDALLRTEDDTLSRRYVAMARSIVEATLRYLGRDLAWTATDVNGELLSPEDRVLVFSPIDALFSREEFAAKFGSLKRWMLVKGDSLLHITADPTKAEGTRIRITELSPETYFPKFDPVDEERVVGCYIVKQVLADDGTTSISMRLGYDRVMTVEDSAETGLPIGSIRVDLRWFAEAKWDDRYPLTEADLSPVPVPERYNTKANQLLAQGVPLPSHITALPVYHFRNNRNGTNPFGLSEIQGVETLLAGLTQTLSDEDMAIALQGIGMYATDSGHPRTADGEETDWVIAPGSVAELEQGGKFWRVEGATNVDSMQAHSASLKEGVQQSTGVPEVAMGKVDVQVAQSGIALAIQMAPMTAKDGEKEDELKSKLNQFMYDLVNGWLPAYESYNGNGVTIKSSFGNPLPVNRAEVLAEIVALVNAQLISREFALTLLQQRLGFQIPDDMMDQILSEQDSMLDPTGSRLAAEAEPTAVE